MLNADQLDQLRGSVKPQQVNSFQDLSDYNSYTQWVKSITPSAPHTPSQQFSSDFAKTPIGRASDVTRGALSNLGDNLAKGVTDEAKAGLQDYRDVQTGKLNPIAGGAKIAGHAAGAFTSPITGVMNAGIQKAGDIISDSNTLQKIVSSPHVKPVIDSIFGGIEKFQEVASQHPEAMDWLETVNKLATFGLTAAGLPEVVKGVGKALPKVESTLRTGAGGISKGATMATDAATDAASWVKTKAGNMKTGATSKLAGKTETEILATPIEDVPKLSAAERTIYNNSQKTQVENFFKPKEEAINLEKTTKEQSLADEFRKNKEMTVDEFKKQQDILAKEHQEKLDAVTKERGATLKQTEQQHAEIQSKIEADLKVKSDAYLSEAETMKSNIDKISVSEANSLKKPVVDVIKKNSEHYEKLFDEDFTPQKQNTKNWSRRLTPLQTEIQSSRWTSETCAKS